jgi:hypothetical protein
MLEVEQSITIELVAQNALFSEDIELTLLVNEFLRSNSDLGGVPRPPTTGLRVLAVAAGLLNLFAIHIGQSAPERTQSVSPMPAPFFLQSSAMKWPQIRQQCLEGDPEPLKKRLLYATRDFLQTVLQTILTP